MIHGQWEPEIPLNLWEPEIPLNLKEQCHQTGCIANFVILCCYTDTWSVRTRNSIKFKRTMSSDWTHSKLLSFHVLSLLSFFLSFLYCTWGTFSFNVKFAKKVLFLHGIRRNRTILRCPLWCFPHNVQQRKGFLSCLNPDTTMMGKRASQSEYSTQLKRVMQVYCWTALTTTERNQTMQRTWYNL